MLTFRVFYESVFFLYCACFIYYFFNTQKKNYDVLARYNLHVLNMRGQWYDGASNMCGTWNGVKALFFKDCPYAYYVHCFAHRLQLTLVAL
jgi:hypothetical protein